MMASREILKMHGEIQAIGERTISGTLDFQNEPKPAVSIYLPAKIIDSCQPARTAQFALILHV